jgi:hypothetical protein
LKIFGKINFPDDSRQTVGVCNEVVFAGLLQMLESPSPFFSDMELSCRCRSRFCSLPMPIVKSELKSSPHETGFLCGVGIVSDGI